MNISGVEFNTTLEEILNELVSELRLNDIQYLQKMKSSGNSIQVCCPYHNDGMERRPSAGIRKTDGVFHCLACNETHSLQEVISFCFGYTKDMIGAFGWKWLLRNFATVSVEERPDVKIDVERNNFTYKANVEDNKSAILDNIDIPDCVTEEELDSYRYYHPYWTKRGITDEYIIELFDLGYDAKTRAITFPVRDRQGNCLFVARRSVRTKWFNYPVGAIKPLYGMYELSKQPEFPKELYITESMIDCLLLWQYGKYAVALNGLGSDSQFEELRKLPCRKYILATDSDKAGMAARSKLRQELKHKLISEVVLPDGRKDIGECTKEEILNLQEIF